MTDYKLRIGSLVKWGKDIGIVVHVNTIRRGSFYRVEWMNADSKGNNFPEWHWDFSCAVDFTILSR